MDFRILTHRTRQELVALALVLLAASGSCQGPRVGVVSSGGSGAGDAGGHDGGMGGSSGNDAGGDGGAAGDATGGSGGASGDNGGSGNAAGSGGEPGDNGGSGNSAGNAGGGNSAGVGGFSGSGGGGAVGGGGLAGATGGVIYRNCEYCQREKLGTPGWEPTGAIVLPASVNTMAFSTIPGWLGSFLEGYHRFYRDEAVFGPGKVHLPPYDEELSVLAASKEDPHGVATPMVPRQEYTLAEYTAPSGIVLLFSLVPSPGAPMGLAAEFDWGPIIPNSVFPLLLDPEVYRGDEAIQSAGDDEYPGYDTFTTPVRVDDDGNRIEVDGASHVILAFPLNDTFIRTDPGEHEYRVTIMDSDRNGGGWRIIVPFSLTD